MSDICRSMRPAKGKWEGERDKHTHRESSIYLEHAEDGGDVGNGGVVGSEVGVDVFRKTEPNGLFPPPLGKNHVVDLPDEELGGRGGREENDKE